MKTTRLRFAWAIGLFGITCAVQTASAFYNPELGRWATRDPLGEPGFEALRGERMDVSGDGPNLYQYVRNDPVNDFDSMGLLVAPPPAPPVVIHPAPVVFICFYAGTDYICEKTGFHDWLAGKMVQCTKSDLEKCKDDCYDSYLSDVDFCKGLRTKRQREYCYRQAFRLYSDCLKECQKQYGSK